MSGSIIALPSSSALSPSLTSSYDAEAAKDTTLEVVLGRLSTRHKAEMDTLLTLNFQLFDDVPLLSA
jgi:hypothetical protein